MGLKRKEMDRKSSNSIKENLRRQVDSDLERVRRESDELEERLYRKIRRKYQTTPTYGVVTLSIIIVVTLGFLLGASIIEIEKILGYFILRG